jgi:hypothetical protein
MRLTRYALSSFTINFCKFCCGTAEGTGSCAGFTDNDTQRITATMTILRVSTWGKGALEGLVGGVFLSVFPDPITNRRLVRSIFAGDLDDWSLT